MHSIEWRYYPVTLSYPQLPQTTPFSAFCIAVHMFVVDGVREELVAMCVLGVPSEEWLMPWMLSTRNARLRNLPIVSGQLSANDGTSELK